MQFVFNLKNHTASTLVTTANLSGGVFIEALTSKFCDLAYEVGPSAAGIVWGLEPLECKVLCRCAADKTALRGCPAFVRISLR